MTERMTIVSDREVLTRTLLEILSLMEEINQVTWLRSSWRVRVRAQFLLLHLCTSHLSASQVTSIRQMSRVLADLLASGSERSRDRESPSILTSDWVLPREGG